jgi:3-oxoadipate CoA-transferase alpha subunit
LINKIVATVQDAVSGVADGSSILVSGFGGAGLPLALLDALLESGAKNLTIVSNNAGNGGVGIAKLVLARRVQKMVCSFPRQPESGAFDDLYRAGEIELELVPQGTLAERIRAGGAGIGGFFTPTGYGTELGEGKEVKVIDGVHQVFEKAIKADVALIKAELADRYGNLIYHGTARNYGPVMATAAACTVVQVSRIVPLGSLNPEHVVTPGVYVQRVVCVQPQGAL